MPYLVALTPRAGRWNHRHLTPPGLKLDTGKLYHLFGLARETAIGPSWIAVSHHVTQPTTGRPGEEILILGDMDTDLDRPEIEKVESFLNERLGDLEKLVEKTDWETQGQNDPVVIDKLNEWLSDLPVKISESKDQEWKSSDPKNYRTLLKISSVTIATATVASLIVASFLFGNSESNTAPEKSDENQESPTLFCVDYMPPNQGNQDSSCIKLGEKFGKIIGSPNSITQEQHKRILAYQERMKAFWKDARDFLGRMRKFQETSVPIDSILGEKDWDYSVHDVAWQEFNKHRESMNSIKNEIDDLKSRIDKLAEEMNDLDKTVPHF